MPLCDVAMHVGGSGTTAACARHGLIQLVLPLHFDQFFWAARVQDMELGFNLSHILADIYSRSEMHGAFTDINSDDGYEVPFKPLTELKSSFKVAKILNECRTNVSVQHHVAVMKSSAVADAADILATELIKYRDSFIIEETSRSTS